MTGELETKKVTLNWLTLHENEPITLKNLPEFFNYPTKDGKRNGEKGGIYFWIYQGQPKKERIAYIGQAGCFQDRFLGENGHIFQVFHGMRSAFAGDDLLAAYAKCNTDYFYQKNGTHYYNSAFGSPNFRWKEPDCFKKIADKPDEYLQKIQDGIKLSVDYLKNMRFVFAEITEPHFDNAKDGGPTRKNIEALCMQRLLHQYEEKYGKYGKDKPYYYTYRYNSFFWGSIDRGYPMPGLLYTIAHINGNSIDNTVQEELGFSNKDKTWMMNVL